MKHPEQDLIDIILMGHIAGVDESNGEQYLNALKQLSDNGRKELEQQRKEVDYEMTLHFMPLDSTRH